MKKKLFILILSIGVISGCSGSQQSSIVGNDKDSHGCIASAGYQWCHKENSCVRSWELAKEKGFNNTEKALNDYCKQ